MAAPSPEPLPSTLPQALHLLWGEVFRRPGTLLAATAVPTLLGWLAVAAAAASTLSSGRWENGTITTGTWLDLPPGPWFMGVLAHSGLPVAYAVAAVLVVPHRVGPRTRPVAPRVALAVAVRRLPLLVGWWVLIGAFLLLVIGGSYAFWTGRAGSEESFDVLMLAVGLAVLPVCLSLALPLLPVALLEGLPLWNRKATQRVGELSSGRRFAEFVSFLLAVLLLMLPARAAARVADLPADTVDGITLGMVTQGLLLGLVAPFAVMTVLAPLLLPGGDFLRVSRELRNAKADGGRHAVLGALAVVVLLVSPPAGAQLVRSALTGVPRLSTAGAPEVPDAMEPLSDGSGYAMLGIGPGRDAGADADAGPGPDAGADPLILSTCGRDCATDRVREREVGVLPEDSRFVAGAVVPMGGDLVGMVAHVRGGLGSTPAEEGYPLVLDIHRCTESACGEHWTAEAGDALDVRAHAPYPGSTTLDLYGYDLEAAVHESGALGVLVQPSDRPLEVTDPQAEGALLLTCSTADCGEARVRELPGVADASLALGRDGSPVIAHPGADGTAVELLVCGDPACADHETRRVPAPTNPSAPADVRPVASVAVGPSGAPQMAVADGQGTRLLYHACADASCSSWRTRTLLVSSRSLDTDQRPHLVVDGDGRPSVLFRDVEVQCHDPYCGAGT
ncbi:hypothetical protein ACFXKD_03415 [Nocardiopsis aegyptia]|uniref:hypothetical protein n=1 Tax=Nocardiopsis aegyptia TaxID=220378 RepID=UPI00366BEF4E